MRINIENRDRVVYNLYRREYNSLFMVKTKRMVITIIFTEVTEMDLKKIGKFIAVLRKENGYTQEQLGEKIGVTNKTISRWETGTYLPPADILLIMSDLFKVSINEILSGERLTDEKYKVAAEENIKQMIKSGSFSIKEKIDFYKNKWLKDHIFLIIVAGLCISGLVIAGIIINKKCLFIALVMFIITHCIRYNMMMTYVEKNAYDGTGIENADK